MIVNWIPTTPRRGVLNARVRSLSANEVRAPGQVRDKNGIGLIAINMFWCDNFMLGERVLRQPFIRPRRET